MAALSDPIYMDTSALVKLVIREPESDALSEHLESSGSQMTTSLISEIELLRAVSRIDDISDRAAAFLLSRQVLLPLSESIRIRAAYLGPLGIRSLDAIHLATAVEVQPSLDSLVSYDNRMVKAAEFFGLNVISPS